METKLLILLGLLLVNCIAVLCYDDNDYCYSDDKTPYKYFGTKTPYDNVRSTEITTPAEDCWTTYIWALISHGTRHVTDSDGLNPQSLSDIRDEIVKNHEEYGRGELCDGDLDLLKKWKFPWDQISYGRLAAQGKTDMENLGVRWGKKFPAFVNQHDKFRFQSSSDLLSRDSATAFREKIYGSEPRIDFNDQLFKVGPYINASENKELDEFTKTNLMDDILYEISTRLGYEKTLTFDFVIKLYRQCALEKANKPSYKSAFCSVFPPDDLEVLEYCDDLDSYYALGYGDSSNTNRGCSLARDLFEKMDKITLSDMRPQQQGVYNFGHGYNVLTLLTKLGLFVDSKPPKHDNFVEQDSREWRTSFIDPFASNFFAVMYNCSHELKISFYVNEGRVNMQSPGCEKGVCLWSTLRKTFRKEILKGCSRSSAIRLLPVNVPSIIYMLVLIFSLHSWCKFIYV